MLAQLGHVTLAGLRGIPARWGASLVVVLSIAGVVGVMVSLLAMAEGFRGTFADAGDPDRVIIMRQGNDNGMGSAVSRDQLPTLLDAPGFARDAAGQAVATPQKFMTSVLRDREQGEEVNVLLRGVGPRARAVWPELRITAGRDFRPGHREFIAGRAAVGQFAGLEIGSTVELSNGPWTVVGHYEAGGAVYESELQGDVEMVFAGYSITGLYSSVVGRLASQDAFDALRTAIETNPTLTHTVQREPEYFSQQTGNLGALMLGLGYAVSAIMGLGALFSAVNTMYAVVASRRTEIATLRALGFGALPVVSSVLLEAVVLCLAGAALGIAAAWLLFSGHTISTLSGSNFSQVAFAFRVTGDVVATALTWAGVIGLLGGMPPAWRAARMPVAEALRA